MLRRMRTITVQAATTPAHRTLVLWHRRPVGLTAAIIPFTLTDTTSPNTVANGANNDPHSGGSMSLIFSYANLSAGGTHLASLIKRASLLIVMDQAGSCLA